jgi:hypothetical protein
LRVDVEADHPAALAERDGERQADIAEPDYADRGLAVIRRRARKSGCSFGYMRFRHVSGRWVPCRACCSRTGHPGKPNRRRRPGARSGRGTPTSRSAVEQPV